MRADLDVPQAAVMLSRGLAALLSVSVLGACTPHPWVGSWSASPQETDEPLEVRGATLRYPVRLSVGGERVRVVVRNDHGAQPLLVGAVHVAWRGPKGREDRTVTFGRSAAVKVPAHGNTVSDPVALAVPDLSEIEVSVFFPEEATLATEHSLALGAVELSVRGDFTALPQLPVQETVEVLGPVLDVEVEAAASAVVVLGDSLVDGVGSSAGMHRRWSEVLAERLVASGRRCAVLNQGIGGARLLHPFVGEAGLARFDRDVLAKTGVRAVFVELGLNDLGIPGAFPDFRTETVTPEELMAGYRQLVARGHARGVAVYGVTLGPFEGAQRPGYFTAAGEAARARINEWLRTSHTFDGVLDLDAVLRDPAHPARLNPAFDSGDHLHPNDAGYRAVALAVDLRWLDAR